MCLKVILLHMVRHTMARHVFLFLSSTLYSQIIKPNKGVKYSSIAAYSSACEKLPTTSRNDMGEPFIEPQCFWSSVRI